MVGCLDSFTILEYQAGALNNVARVQAWVNPNNGISNAISNIRQENLFKKALLKS